MHAPKLKTWTTSTADASTVFDALLGVVQSGKYTVVGLTNEHRKILFTSGKSALSWGQEYVGEVTEADGGTQVDLVCGGVDGAPKALLDGMKNSKKADKVLAAVAAAVDGSTPAPATPTASFATLADGSTVPWTTPEYPGQE